jgi:hypothetical protein
MVIVQNFAVMLVEILNHYAELCNFVQCFIFVNYLTC